MIKARRARRELNLNCNGAFNPAAAMQRLDQLPGFIPLKTGDPIPDELRQSLNVEAYVYELRQIALQIVESELEP